MRSGLRHGERNGSEGEEKKKNIPAGQKEKGKDSEDET